MLAIISFHQSLVIPRSSEQLLTQPPELSSQGKMLPAQETLLPASLLVIKRICRPSVGRFCREDLPVCREQSRSRRIETGKKRKSAERIGCLGAEFLPKTFPGVEGPCRIWLRSRSDHG